MSKIKLFAAALTGAAGLVLAAALPAGATLDPHAVETVGNGAAGYSVTNGPNFRNAGVQIVTTPAALNIGHVSGTSNTGGLGVQLCDPNTGFGIQAGEVSTGKAFDVEFAKGVLKGAAADNCVGNPLLPGANHLQTTNLSGVPVGDSVDVFIAFHNVKVHRWVNHHRRLVWQGRAKVQAQDETGGFEVYSSGWLSTRPDFDLTESGFGVQQETSGLSADTPLTCPNIVSPLPSFPPGCPGTGTPTGAAYNGTSGPHATGAHTALACFASFVNGKGLALPPLPGSPPIFAYGIHEVATTGNGLNANTALVAPNNSFQVSRGPELQGCSLPDMPVSFGPFQFQFADYVGNVTH